jgi:cysteine desulfurase NifS
MRDVMTAYGNPSSIHREGKRARKIVDKARRIVAGQLGCTAKRIIFTGSGSEANNLAIKGIAFANRGDRNHIITSSIEHPAVLNTCRWLESNGFDVTYLGVDQTGRIRPGDLEEAITDRTCLVSVMLANNETGTVQPVEELARLARDRSVPFHSDAVQAVGKIPVDVGELGVDLLTLSAHKLHGPKGVGALYVRKGIEIENLVHGGGQEGGIRSGTENVIEIAGFGKAMDGVPRYLEKMNDVEKMRDRLEEGIMGILPEARLNGHRLLRLPNTLNMTLPELRGESVVLEMDRRGVMFSSGSACHSGSPDPSHALLAMGLTEEEVHCALRFSLGHDTTERNIKRTIELLSEVIERSRNIVRFVSCK